LDEVAAYGEVVWSCHIPPIDAVTMACGVEALLERPDFAADKNIAETV
jgi:hypothetical protein